MNPFKPDHISWFDHWLIAADMSSTGIVETAITDVLSQETRTRRRSASSLATLQRTVDNVLSNLLRRTVYPISGVDRVAVSRDKRRPPARYKSETHTDAFPVTLDALTDLGYVEQSVGDWYEGRTTTIRAGAKLKAHVETRHVDPQFERMPGQEIVVLKTDKTRYDPGQFADYTDDAHTTRLRSQMRVINEAVDSYEIEYTGSAAVDLDDRFMRR